MIKIKGKVVYGPKIVQSGLVVSLDAANPRSYSGSGTAWYDMSGNSNHATLGNGPSFISSNNGYFSFDGVDDYAVFDGSEILDSQGTVNVWSAVGSSGSNRFIFNSVGSSTNRYYIRQPIAYNIDAVRGTLSTYTSSFGGVSVNTWNNFTLTWDSTTLYTYLNGVFVASGSYVGAGTPASTSTYLACSSPGFNHFNGSISIIQAYNRKLSSQEIKQNYNALKTRFI